MSDHGVVHKARNFDSAVEALSEGSNVKRVGKMRKDGRRLVTLTNEAQYEVWRERDRRTERMTTYYVHLPPKSERDD